MYEYVQKEKKTGRTRIQNISNPVIQRFLIDKKEYKDENSLFAAAIAWLKSVGVQKSDTKKLRVVVHNIFNGEDLTDETEFHNLIARGMGREDLIHVTEDTEEEPTDGRMTAEEEEETEEEIEEETEGESGEDMLQYGTIQIGKKRYPSNMVFKRYSGPVVTLYRSMSAEEYKELCGGCVETGQPLFSFAPGRKGGEKYFAPNLAYLLGGSRKGNRSMHGKGKREILVKVLLLPSVSGELVYNPQYSGYAQGSEEPFMKKLGIKQVRSKSGHHIVLKLESPEGGGGISFSSLNVGFKSPQSLDQLARYIVSIHVVDMEQRISAKRRLLSETVSRLPILTEKVVDERMDMQNEKKQPLEDMDETEDAQEEEEELPLMEMHGNIFTIDGRSYDIGSNQVESGQCLWRLLSDEAGISEEILEAAAEACDIGYMDYVDTEELGALVMEINRRIPAGMRIQIALDVFYYDGRYDMKKSRTYGSGVRTLHIGGVFAPDGQGHYVMKL